MESAGIHERLFQVVEYSGLTINGFAKAIGVVQSTLDKQTKGTSAVSIETINKVLAYYPSLSVRWLFKGEGDMFDAETSQSENLERINRLIDTIVVIQTELNEVKKQLDEEKARNRSNQPNNNKE